MFQYQLSKIDNDQILNYTPVMIMLYDENLVIVFFGQV